jgi:DNA polymerase III subunit epsilon
MLPCYVLLDLETTGGTPLHSRITEIAAVRIEHGQEVARWSSLVNPGVRIPYFIQTLTGISDAMVQDAPSFNELSAQLLQLLDGAVLVAHNARFDHGFLLHEFARIDVALRVKTLCTVRLSRKLYPQHKGHGLDAIMQRHGRCRPGAGLAAPGPTRAGRRYGEQPGAVAAAKQRRHTAAPGN